MKIKIFYILFPLLFVFFGTSCSSEEDDTEENAEKLEQVVDTFFYNLFSYQFESCKELVTKASYSSLGFLNNASQDIQLIDLVDVDSCVVNGKQATCVCEFHYADGGKVYQEINLGKYDDEWLIDFQLGNNFDNIFIYNYGYTLNDKWKDVTQTSLDGLVQKEIKEVLSRMKSSKLKLGFSSYEELGLIDVGYDGNAYLGSSVKEASGLRITTNYTFIEERLASCVVDIEAADLDREDVLDGDMFMYAESLTELLVEELGRPFNVPDARLGNMYLLEDLRWFVKSYNEMLTLTYAGGHFSLTINEIP